VQTITSAGYPGWQEVTVTFGGTKSAFVVV
jgi:hypothetical protein